MNNNIERLGRFSFYHSKFSGEFNGGKIKYFEQSSLYYSNFVGDFKSNYVIEIEQNAFCTTTFDGSFISNSVVTIGPEAFRYTIFTGDFIAENLKTIGTSFQSSAFKGKLYTPNLVKGSPSSFGSNSKFSETTIPDNTGVVLN